jgi:hypothetical protein
MLQGFSDTVRVPGWQLWLELPPQPPRNKFGTLPLAALKMQQVDPSPSSTIERDEHRI